MTPADLVGRFDLSTIGMMGHSRGGEGVTSAATLNQGPANPWAIESILPLAPVDFGRMIVPNIPMNVILPYCDGVVRVSIPAGKRNAAAFERLSVKMAADESVVTGTDLTLTVVELGLLE